MNSIKLLTILGARPQFIKAAAVSRAIVAHNDAQAAERVDEVLVHTGQHYDYEMSEVFFRELGLPDPSYHLEVGSGSHGYQTGQILERLETPMTERKPDLVLVYGDTNTTLAGALAAAKLHVPVAHVEAGLRSFNRRMPEEINRVLTDHLCTLLFCPSERSVQNLAREGIRAGVRMVGDVMYDVCLWHLSRSKSLNGLLKDLELQPGKYALATVHRAENTDTKERLQSIFAALESLAGRGLKVVIPLHPRTRKMLQVFHIPVEKVKVIQPLGYESMLCLGSNAQVILTDSGGLQKEAYWLGVPCVTLREETEWVETVEAGWNLIVGSDSDRIIESAMGFRPVTPRASLYGDGDAARHILSCIAQWQAQAANGEKIPGSD